MSNRFRPVWLLVFAVPSISVLVKAPETANTGYQKANTFTLLKYRDTLDESLKKQGIAARRVEFPIGPQMLERLNIGSIDLTATGDAPPALAQTAQADLVYLVHSPANPKTEATVVSKQSTIHNMVDLKGKRARLNEGSDVNCLPVATLEKADLSYKDIVPIYLPPANARVALQRGTINAWVIWDPFLAEMETNAKARQTHNIKELVPHYTFYLTSRKFVDIYPEIVKQVVNELSKLGMWANSHQDEATGLLSTSTGLDKAIWLKTLARLPYDAERMTPVVYNEQQALADTFTCISLLSVKVDVHSATWSLNKP